MGNTYFPNGFRNGVNIQGVNILNTYGGNVYWVDSGANTPNANVGSFNHPATTLNEAMDLVTANNGDIVILKAGHNEACTSATTQVIDVAGCTIVGLGNGSDAPTFDFDNTAGSFEINSANTVIENVRFRASVSAVVVGVNVDADNVTLRNCVWNFEATGDDFVIMVDVDGVDYCTIEGCRFEAEAATAGADHAIRIAGADWCKILGNYITGDYAAGPITGETTVSTQIVIAHNYIYNDDTAFAQNGIDLNNACTGIIAYNAITTLQATDVYSLLDPGSCLCVENYAVNAIDERAVVAPTTAAGTG